MGYKRFYSAVHKQILCHIIEHHVALPYSVLYNLKAESRQVKKR